MAPVLQYVDPSDARFCVAIIAILFNPFFWNVVARWEHRTRGLTRLFGGPYVACYCLGFLILLLNVYRSHSITVAMKAQGRWEVLERAHPCSTLAPPWWPAAPCSSSAASWLLDSPGPSWVTTLGF
ncbi:hypothetical protein AAFF_G00367850 [Aldrovandia affinis]|uniref:Phosphatidylethanolamine N-methyltransferase n=1 Tax=Aldrovandia affinis TaxID=143900 RepID=A0AAD7R513_9TELE|nr:hypothetical protein AAFF_G00367850 [Aldrovandia affinis]